MNQPLSNKVALVTGGSRGIGAAICQKLAAHGAHVVVNYASSADAANHLVEQIRTDGGKVIAIKADMSDPAQVINLFDEAEKVWARSQFW